MTASTPDPLPRIAVVGFQGFGNVGDEAILAGIEALLGGRVEVTAIFAGRTASIPAFPRAERISTRRHLPGVGAWRRLRGVDALAISGGGLINDYWATVIPRYVLWCLTARLAGARVVWIGAGVGPIRRRPWRWLAGLGFRLSRLVTVRDGESEAWVRRCHRRARVAVIPDPAFFIPWPEPGPASDRDLLSARRGGIIVVARAPAPTASPTPDELAAALVDVVAWACGRGHRVEILGLHAVEDGPFLERLGEAIRGRGLGDVPFASPATPDEAIAVLGAADALVSVRLHGVILGALAGVPSIAVAYDPKVAQAAAALGLADMAVAAADVSGSTLSEALERLLADPGRRGRLAETVATLRERRAAVGDLLVRALA